MNKTSILTFTGFVISALSAGILADTGYSAKSLACFCIAVAFISAALREGI